MYSQLVVSFVSRHPLHLLDIYIYKYYSAWSIQKFVEKEDDF